MNRLEKIDQIGILTIDNPPQNFLTDPEFINKDDLLVFIHQKNIKGLIITGLGRHFSAGADLDNLYNQLKAGKLKSDMNRGLELINALSSLEIPTISAIEGVCFGGGFEIALSTHMRFSSKKSLFAFPEANHNLVPGLGGIKKLQEKTNITDAFKIGLTGEIINCDEALKLGLVDRVFNAKTVFKESFDFLKSITKNRPNHVIHALTRCINFSILNTSEKAMKYETEEFIKLATKALND